MKFTVFRVCVTRVAFKSHEVDCPAGARDDRVHTQALPLQLARGDI